MNFWRKSMSVSLYCHQCHVTAHWAGPVSILSRLSRMSRGELVPPLYRTACSISEWTVVASHYYLLNSDELVPCYWSNRLKKLTDWANVPSFLLFLVLRSINLLFLPAVFCFSRNNHLYMLCVSSGEFPFLGGWFSRIRMMLVLSVNPMNYVIWNFGPEGWRC